MKSEDISDNQIKEMAEYIIVRHTEDIEYLSVAEMTDDQLDIDSSELNQEDRQEVEKIWRRVDDMIGEAIVTVEFEK